MYRQKQKCHNKLTEGMTRVRRICYTTKTTSKTRTGANENHKHCGNYVRQQENDKSLQKSSRIKQINKINGMTPLCTAVLGDTDALTLHDQSCPWVGLTHGLGWVGLGQNFSVFGELGQLQQKY